MEKFKTSILILITALCLYLTYEADAQTVKVMVIDTGVDLSHKEIKSHVREKWNFTDYMDDVEHGTAMASLVLKGTCGDIELVSCNYYFTWNKNKQVRQSNVCFERALNENVQYINYSSYGPDPDDTEKAIIKKLVKKGVIITVAAGNESEDLLKTGKCENSYPACYGFKNVYVLQNIDRTGKIFHNSNRLKGKYVRSMVGVNIPVLYPKGKKGFITGTSPSSARYMNSILLHKCWELRK